MTEPIRRKRADVAGRMATNPVKATTGGTVSSAPIVMHETGGVMTMNIGPGFTIKMSHRYLRNSPHFAKTMRDIRLMRSFGAKIPDNLRDWLRRREKETYAYAHPKLNQGKMGFFSGDGIRYVYDHDSLHVAMAFGPAPAYTLYQKDGAEVAVDRAKWDRLTD